MLPTKKPAAAGFFVAGRHPKLGGGQRSRRPGSLQGKTKTARRSAPLRLLRLDSPAFFISRRGVPTPIVWPWFISIAARSLLTASGSLRDSAPSMPKLAFFAKSMHVVSVALSTGWPVAAAADETSARPVWGAGLNQAFRWWGAGEANRPGRAGLVVHDYALGATFLICASRISASIRM